MEFRRSGPGAVPAATLLSAAVKQLGELASGGVALVPAAMSAKLSFSLGGADPYAVRDFLQEALLAGKSQEPTIETGNKYGVRAAALHAVNSELLMEVAECGEGHAFRSLVTPEHRARAAALWALVFRDPDMRNRNCLHPAKLDSAVIGNLLNFPKHLFGFPYACHATDGNESLSLCLFSYRQLWAAKQRSAGGADTAPVVLFCSDAAPPTEDLRLCAERLGMGLVVRPSVGSRASCERVAVVVTSFQNPTLGTVAQSSEALGLPVHLHLCDAQWRAVFAGSEAPVHFELPSGVRSLSIEEGLFRCGYSVYRDLVTRDLHLDVSYAWQTAYMSPNEGGSGGSEPLFSDFCSVQLGWTALREMARHGAAPDRGLYRLAPTVVVPLKAGGGVGSSEADADPTKGGGQGQVAIDAALRWGKRCIQPATRVPREELEAALIRFQQTFVGGEDRTLEGITTGGGTRSINIAFESVLVRAKRSGYAFKGRRVKVLTGNPHLAVERAERRFQFDLERVVSDGAICVEQLVAALRDPAVAAVYSQTLSYTDGITDPLLAVVNAVEAENRIRAAEAARSGGEAMLVTLINDCCLAFSVLVHNPGGGGGGGSPSARVFDLTKEGITPVLVTLDAHKHLGADKGISTVMGTDGTLTCLRGGVKVGAQPRQEDLVRGLASMRLVGVGEYKRLYHELGAIVERAAATLEAAGMVIVHRNNRIAGSTVISVEDPSGVLIKKLKKKGHALASLFNLRPSEPSACQTGWQLSLTPHALRRVERDGVSTPALDIFLHDAVESHKEAQASAKLGAVRSLLRENSLVACLVGGNIDPWLLPMLAREGSRRNATQMAVRRFFTAQLDCGTIRTARRVGPAKTLLQRLAALLAFVVVVLASIRRRRLRGK